jgi:hypothetical protein
MAPTADRPIDHLPIRPEDLLRQHHVHEPLDTRFRSCARLLQALWREARNIPIGSYRAPSGTRRKLGSRITPAAGRAGATFLSSAVATMVRREIAYREIGALVDESRLYTNLLSSMPLTFNLLGPLRLDLPLATRVLHQLCPDLDHATVRAVWFEHSPGRGSPALTSDFTSFDVFVRYDLPNTRTGFVALEVKYAESMQSRRRPSAPAMTRSPPPPASSSSPQALRCAPAPSSSSSASTAWPKPCSPPATTTKAA